MLSMNRGGAVPGTPARMDVLRRRSSEVRNHSYRHCKSKNRDLGTAQVQTGTRRLPDFHRQDVKVPVFTEGNCSPCLTAVYMSTWSLPVFHRQDVKVPVFTKGTSHTIYNRRLHVTLATPCFPSTRRQSLCF
jgi:hypothetical protein